MDFGIVSKILDPILDAGALFMIFFVFTAIGLIVRLGPLRAIRNGLMIAVGFNGVYIVVDYFLGQVAPAAEALALRFGGVFTYADIGWSAFASFAFAWPGAYAVIVLSLAVNLVMIFTRMTDTLNLNIWDFWEQIIAAIMVTLLTNNFAAGLLFGSFLTVVNLTASDFNSQRGHTAALGFEGLSFYQGTNVAGSVWSMLESCLTRLIESQIYSRIHSGKFGVIGEPAFRWFDRSADGYRSWFLLIDIVLLMIALATSLVLIPMMSGIVSGAGAGYRSSR